MTKVNSRKPANWYLCFWNDIVPKFVNILISCAEILSIDTSPTNMLLVPLFDKITIKFYVGFLGTVNSHLPIHTGIQLRRDQFSIGYSFKIKHLYNVAFQGSANWEWGLAWLYACMVIGHGWEDMNWQSLEILQITF